MRPVENYCGSVAAPASVVTTRNATRVAANTSPAYQARDSRVLMLSFPPGWKPKAAGEAELAKCSFSLRRLQFRGQKRCQAVTSVTLARDRPTSAHPPRHPAGSASPRLQLNSSLHQALPWRCSPIPRNPRRRIVSKGNEQAVVCGRFPASHDPAGEGPRDRVTRFPHLSSYKLHL